MEDMKRLIEKYKQELMEYSKAAAPREKLDFPEMIDDTEEESAPKTTSDIPEVSAAHENSDDYPPRGDSLEGYSDLMPHSDTSDFSRSDINKSDEEDGAVSPGGFRYLPDDEQKTASSTARKPEIIGYVADGNSSVLSDYSNIFADMLPRSSETDNDNRSEETAPDAPENDNAADAPLYTTIPSQRENSEMITETSTPEGNLNFTGEISGVTDNTPTEPLPEPAEVQNVSPESAEELSRQPVSGQNPEEQLTGRSFENEELPANSREDIKPLHENPAPTITYNQPTYADFKDFERSNPTSENLRFRVFTARGALPIQGAVCEIKKTFAGTPTTLYTLVTDISGQTPAVSLPAPSRSLSQSPENTIQPYALYDASIRAKGFNSVEIKNIPVFDGVLSVQGVAMIPLAGENQTDIINEQEPDINGGV